MGVAPATVRWRLASALKELRRGLDDWNRGKSRSWAALLGARQPTTAGKAALLAKGVLMAKTLKVAIAAIVIFGMLFTGRALLHHPSARKTQPAAPPVFSFSHDSTRPPTKQQEPSLDWIGQPGAARRRIAGHVVLEKGPVAAATVSLTNSVNKMLRITDASGFFDFGTLPAARYQLVATHAQLAPAGVEVDSRDSTANPACDDLVLRLASCRGRLVGVVSDASGGPLAGAEVCEVFGLTGKACASTGPDGGYELCVGHHSNVTVAASASGYGSATLDAMYVGKRSRQDFVLQPEAVLAGKVIDARDGAPIAGALVYVEPTGFGVMRDDRHFTTTDPAGRFTFTKLAGGGHRVTAVKDSSALHSAVGVVLSAGQTMTGLILRLDPYSTISGIVRDSGTPVSGARLRAMGSSQAITQQDGSFVIRLVKRGEVGFDVEGYRVVSPRRVRVDRARVDGVRIDVQAMSSISGRVLLDGHSVEGATVRVGDEFDGPSTLTNTRGEYQLRGLPPESYRVSAESADARGYVESVVVGEGETHGGVDVVLNDAASISGTVLDTHGRPVVGAFVKFQATANGDSGDAITGIDGDFKVGKLAGGDAYLASVKPLSLVMPDLKPPTDHPFPTVAVRDSQAHVNGVQLVVQRGDLSISGTVVDGSGERQSDAVVRAFPASISPTDYYLVPSGISTSDGSFSIASLEEGTYALRATAGGASVMVQGITAGRTDVRIVLPAASHLTGRLVGFHAQPSVWAYAERPGEFPPGIAAIVSGDRFEVRDLVPGHYRVKVRAGAEATVAEIDLPPDQTRNMVVTNPGSASVDGQLIELSSGAPVADASCYAAPRTDTHRPLDVYDDLPVATGADGRFHVEAPVGDIAIECIPKNPLLSDGFSLMTLSPGQSASTRVVVVRRPSSGSRIWIDADIDVTLIPARLTAVARGGAAERAGLRANDLITAVDGVDVTPLSYAGLQNLLFGRAIGSHAKLTVARAGQSIVADVILSAF